MPDSNQILSSMISYLQDKKSKLSDFTPTSTLFQILSAIASVIDQIYFSIENAQKQAYVSTATASGLDAKGEDLGVVRKGATAAQWIFTFTKKQSSAQEFTIPKGTLITTLPSPGQEPIVFATDDNVVLPVASLAVSVSATCRTLGSSGNISAGTQLLIGSSVPGIDGVLLESLDGGTYGNEVETDDAYRERLLKALASRAQGTVTWYEQTALSVPGVQLARVVPQGRGPGTVDIYVVPSDETIPLAELIKNVTELIDAGRIITDDAKVFGPTLINVDLMVNIQVAVEYAEANVEEQVRLALTQYINSLGIGGGTYGTLYQARAQAVDLSVPGVLNIVPVNPPPTDIAFQPYQLPRAGTITVNRV